MTRKQWTWFSVVFVALPILILGGIFAYDYLGIGESRVERPKNLIPEFKSNTEVIVPESDE